MNWDNMCRIVQYLTQRRSLGKELPSYHMKFDSSLESHSLFKNGADFFCVSGNQLLEALIFLSHLKAHMNICTHTEF